jgi:hypothetical protein
MELFAMEGTWQNWMWRVAGSLISALAGGAPVKTALFTWPDTAKPICSLYPLTAPTTRILCCNFS